MHEAAHGDDFADWYGALWPRVLRAVTVSVGDPDLAEEATAEAFVKPRHTRDVCKSGGVG